MLLLPPLLQYPPKAFTPGLLWYRMACMKQFHLMFTVMIAMILGCSETTTEEQRSGPGDGSGWLVSFAEAKAKSAEEGKPILMEFTGSDWCPPCMALHDNVLTSDVFKQQIPEKFILLKLDSPRDKSKQTPEEIAQYKKLSSEYNVEGVPTIIVADATGKEQHRQVGYSRETPQEWVAKLIAAGSP